VAVTEQLVCGLAWKGAQIRGHYPISELRLESVASAPVVACPHIDIGIGELSGLPDRVRHLKSGKWLLRLRNS
jgi:hypothetical protein